MEVKKILGQLNPAATTEETLYIVPDLKGAVISSIIVCNRDGNGKSFRIAVCPGGETTGDKNYIYYNKTLDAHESLEIKAGITLSNADEIRVYASATDLSFTAFGAEFDQTNVTLL